MASRDLGEARSRVTTVAANLGRHGNDANAAGQSHAKSRSASVWGPTAYAVLSGQTSGCPSDCPAHSDRMTKLVGPLLGRRCDAVPAQHGWELAYRGPHLLTVSEELKMPKLTKSIVDRAEVPPKGQAFVWCSEDRGFGVRINASGCRTFVAQGRINGKERRVSIGRPGVFSVDQARAQARELLRGMRLGVDPVDEKARKRARGITLRETIADYCTHRRTKNGPLRTRTKADISDHGHRSFADWLDKPITAISRDDCFTGLPASRRPHLHARTKASSSCVPCSTSLATGTARTTRR